MKGPGSRNICVYNGAVWGLLTLLFLFLKMYLFYVYDYTIALF